MGSPARNTVRGQTAPRRWPAQRELDVAKILGYNAVMAKVKIGELRDHVSEYVRRAQAGETIVIVNRDREVAVLRAWRGRGKTAKRLLGCLAGTATVTDDIVSPIIPESDWFRS
jgi:antitoxin (DNA-binding transcriptional repressor) of toxin-antitoxin stability system